MIKILNLVASFLAATSIVSVVANSVVSKNSISITKSKAFPPGGRIITDHFDKDFYVDISFNYEGLLSIANVSHFSSSNWFYNFLTNYEGFDSGKLSWWAPQGTGLQGIMKGAYGTSGLDSLQDLINGNGTSSDAQGWPSPSQNHIYYYNKFNFKNFAIAANNALKYKNGLYLTIHFYKEFFSIPNAAAAYLPILTNPPTPAFNQSAYQRGASKRIDPSDIDSYKYYTGHAFQTPELLPMATFGYTLNLSWKSVQYLIDSYNSVASRLPSSEKWTATGGFIDYLMSQPYTEYHTSYSDGWDLSSYINADSDSHARGHFIPDVVFRYLNDQPSPLRISNKMIAIVKNAYNNFETININFYVALEQYSDITWFSLENPYNHQICISDAI